MLSPPGTTDTPRITFGAYAVDLGSRELWRDGVPVRLQHQPFEILARLLASPGRVISRDELRRQLWPDGTFVDFEHGLNAAVKRLRTALGDTADHPRYIETVPRQGYRFIASVETTAAAPTPAGTGPRRRVAVLPFVTLGPEDEESTFPEELVEEIVARLGRIHPARLGVVARTSIRRFIDAACPIEEIGRALGVEYVLEGSVRRRHDRVRVSMQLIDAHDHAHVWSEIYERQLDDAFAVQVEIADHVAEALTTELVLPARPVTERTDAPTAPPPIRGAGS